MYKKYVYALDEVFRDFNHVTFSLEFWDGKRFEYGDRSKKDLFKIVIKNKQALKRFLGGGALGFGESFADGSIDIEGDLREFLKLRHRSKRSNPSFRLAYAVFLARATRFWGPSKNIRYHYDLGNDFFSLFLDRKTMSYSCAEFDKKNVTLEEAQLNKLKTVCKWINLPKDSNILDMGSGWGGFAIYAAENREWNVEGLSLSLEQLSYARKKTEDRKIREKVKFLCRSFINFNPRKKYDGIVMLESFEHVGESGINAFLRNISKLVDTGAPIYMQFTGRYKYKKVDPWTLKYVFPGGHLPSKKQFEKALEKTSLSIVNFEDCTGDYKKTIGFWVDSLEENRSIIEKKYGREFFRTWRLWMHGAYVNFDVEDMSLFKFLLRKK